MFICAYIHMFAEYMFYYFKETVWQFKRLLLFLSVSLKFKHNKVRKFTVLEKNYRDSIAFEAKKLGKEEN